LQWLTGTPSAEQGGDPFGPGTQIFPWDGATDVMDAAKERMDAAFEFITKMNIPYYCFHDTDVVGDGSVFEIEKRLEKMVEVAKQKQEASGVKLFGERPMFFPIRVT
jgi:xylose isomerase